MAATAVILAAGKGTRMKSDRPKVVHEILGKPMIDYVLDAAREAGVTRMIVVVGYKADEVKAAISDTSDVDFVLQEEQHGTGHAVMMATPLLKGHDGPVLVLAGDTPLLLPLSLKGLLFEVEDNGAACVVGSAITKNNKGLGRIVRDADGTFTRIVEERDATDKEKEIQEINTGCYAFHGPALLKALEKIKPENDQAEYYLTDTAAILLDQDQNVKAAPNFTIEEAMGVNTKEQLSEVAKVIQSRG
ncbi:sugar phosphate nucleotidyltransferase [Calycomorphotria hydatis]|uniref:Bifunctional protein GlmU n=1 Tax=Calycomorphotria hydatis TaxID=2528027 RepID=A0A517T761_9PLAN|nr:NTP transferase domain-containing protein [Calycomorphotria hydatis]QDT64199.1 Bifunctional protein GlmU [Calycomorphotria hydatis]